MKDQLIYMSKFLFWFAVVTTLLTFTMLIMAGTHIINISNYVLITYVIDMGVLGLVSKYALACCLKALNEYKD